jgi:hypothetical protein
VQHEFTSPGGPAWQNLPTRDKIDDELEEIPPPLPPTKASASSPRPVDPSKLPPGWFRYPSSTSVEGGFAGWWLCWRVCDQGPGSVTSAGVLEAVCSTQSMTSPPVGFRLVLSASGGCLATTPTGGAHWVCSIPVSDLRRLITAATPASLRALVYFQAWDSVISLSPPLRFVLPAAGAGGKAGFLGRSASSWLCDLPIVRTLHQPTARILPLQLLRS